MSIKTRKKCDRAFKKNTVLLSAEPGRTVTEAPAHCEQEWYNMQNVV